MARHRSRSRHRSKRSRSPERRRDRSRESKRSRDKSRSRDRDRSRARDRSRDRRSSHRDDRKRYKSPSRERRRSRDRRDRSKDRSSRRDSSRDRHRRDSSRDKRREKQSSKERRESGVESMASEMKERSKSPHKIDTAPSATDEISSTAPNSAVDSEKTSQPLTEEDKKRLRKERLAQWRSAKQIETETPVVPEKVVVETVPEQVTESPTIETIGKSLFKSGKIMLSIKKPVVVKKEIPKPNIKAFEAIDDEESSDENTGIPKRKFIRLESPEPEEETKVPTEPAEDLLDSYMENVSTEIERLKEKDEKLLLENASSKEAVNREVKFEDEDRRMDRPSGEELEQMMAAALKRIAGKKKDILGVDVGQGPITLEPLRKNFWIEPPMYADMTEADVISKRMSLDNIRIRGVDCPKPVDDWNYLGLHPAVVDTIKKVLKFEKPSPIQAQSIPAIMSGRDVIGIAKTGSGKTIAFLLPMFRHIKYQRPLESTDGPIALIMTPTRELAVQIFRECRNFTKALNLRCVCAYGGAPIKDQIADLKRGAEIVICTPGRIIDLLAINNGKVTNLLRTSYLVLDEADRMFDMGFEPQVMKIVATVRPDRQTLLFSATFPRSMESLARKILDRPLEITVGGRSIVCQDVTQKVEVLPDDKKFLRLLEILGHHTELDPESKFLVFVHRHEAADTLLRDLLKKGYPCQSLHGAKDQSDRDSTISDFKSGVTDILIATSVAARGLDVKQLNVVVNYECPNHLEDYIHRVGRTGRAGNKGTAYTFINPEQEKYAVEIMRALKASNAPIPEDLQKIVDSFMAKVRDGGAIMAGSGFGGKGLEKLEQEREVVKKIQRQTHGAELDEEFEDEETEETEEKTEAEAEEKPESAAPAREEGGKVSAYVAIQKAREKLAELNAYSKSAAMKDGKALYFELEINDYPQKARWRITSKEKIQDIEALTGAAVTTRGTFVPPGRSAPPGEKKLYLHIEASTAAAVEAAREELKRAIVDAFAEGTEASATGKYTV